MRAQRTRVRDFPHKKSNFEILSLAEENFFFFRRKLNGMKKNFLCAGLCILLAALLFLYESGSRPARAVFSVAETNKTVYLTFDDGPSDSSTPKVLDILKKENVKATFFVIGCQIPLRTGIIKRIKDEGHALGLHSYSHDYKEIYASREALLKDIEKCACAVEEVTGYAPSLYRFPGGSFTVDKELIAGVKKAGYHYVDWNASCRDAELISPTAEDLYNAAVSSAGDKNNIILLMHDSAHRIRTVQALPAIIRHFKSKNYTFSTLS